MQTYNQPFHYLRSMVRLNTHGRISRGEYKGLECFIADDTKGESGGYYLYLRVNRGRPEETVYELAYKTMEEVESFVKRNPVLWVE